MEDRRYKIGGFLLALAGFLPLGWVVEQIERHGLPSAEQRGWWLLAGMTGGLRWVLAEAIVAEFSTSRNRGRNIGIFEIGENRLVIGEVLRVHVREGILDPKTWLLNPANYHPIGRMQAPHGYCLTRDQFELQRPR